MDLSLKYNHMIFFTYICNMNQQLHSYRLHQLPSQGAGGYGYIYDM